MNTPIKFTTAEEAVKVIKSGDHVHLSSVASAPQCLIKAMCARGEAGELKNVHVHHLHTEGPAPYADPKFEGVFQLDSLFVGANVRKVTQSGYADYIPIFLSETQKLYRSGAVPCNVAMIQVCPPDKHGYVSLGTSVDATLAAIECADHVIAVVNKYVPRAFGQAMIPLSKIDLFVQDDQPLVEAKFSEPSDVEKAIGAHCAELIEDGATLQMGIGAIPNAVLAQLGNHKNLGIHSITTKGVSKIAPVLDTGAGVVTTRNHIHWLVTENGAVDLYGKTLQERARLVISIAHPSAQEELDRAAFERFGSHHHYIKGYMQK